MKKMTCEIDENTVVAEVVMLRAASKEVIIVVEGGADEKFLTPHLHKSCLFVISYGKEKAVAAITKLNSILVDGVVGIVDQDYEGILEPELDIPNLVRVENDVETLLVKSPAFYRLLTEIGSKPKLRSLDAADIDPREIVRSAAQEIGRLRIYSIKNTKNFKFSGIKYLFVTKEIDVDIKLMIQTIMNNSRINKYNLKELEKDAFETPIDDVDPWRIVSGHDLTAIIGKALQWKFGNLSANAADSGEIERQLRLAYHRDDFVNSKLFVDLAAWEAKHNPYQLNS